MPRFEPLRSLRAIAIGVVPAWLVGVVVMLRLDAPMTMPAMNTAALLVGIAVLLLAGGPLGRRLHDHGGRVGVVLAVLLALPFAFASTDGVHRWIVAGPVRLHASSLFAPIALLSITGLLRRRHFVGALALLTALELLHVVQPDAGQATALAAGAAVAMLRAPVPIAQRVLGVAVAVGATFAAWMRPDPLEPVALVEDMLPRAFELGMPYGIAGLLALAALPGAALVQYRRCSSLYWADALFVLAVYFATTIAVTNLGHFPTPVLGYGASPVFGAILGLGILGGMTSPDDE